MRKINLLKELQSFYVSKLPKFVVKDTDNFECFLFMEFNWSNNPIVLDPEYLDERFSIFDKYTFPSINAQTDNNFNWILFLNDKTPQKYKDKLNYYKENANMNLILEYISGDNLGISELMRKYYSFNTKYLLTCRCDNDDMLAINYIEKLKENFRPVDNMFIDFTQGYCLNHEDGTLNNYKSRSNHFIAYVEKTNPDKVLTTVFCCNHAFAKKKGLIRRINNKKYPLWCEVIHGTNMVNYLQGDKVNNSEQKYFNDNFIIKND